MGRDEWSSRERGIWRVLARTLDPMQLSDVFTGMGIALDGGSRPGKIPARGAGAWAGEAVGLRAGPSRPAPGVLQRQEGVAAGLVAGGRAAAEQAGAAALLSAAREKGERRDGARERETCVCVRAETDQGRQTDRQDRQAGGRPVEWRRGVPSSAAASSHGRPFHLDGNSGNEQLLLLRRPAAPLACLSSRLHGLLRSAAAGEMRSPRRACCKKGAAANAMPAVGTGAAAIEGARIRGSARAGLSHRF